MRSLTWDYPPPSEFGSHNLQIFRFMTRCGNYSHPLAGPRNPGLRTGGIPPVPSIGTDDLHPPMPGIPREFPGPDDIPYPGGAPSPLP